MVREIRETERQKHQTRSRKLGAVRGVGVSELSWGLTWPALLDLPSCLGNPPAPAWGQLPCCIR